MKILIDMNLSPQWREPLQKSGHEVKHWSEVGEANAPDIAIMEWCRLNGFIVFTHDLDYGALLFATKANGPSVLQVRSDDVRPEFLAPAVIKALVEAEREIGMGALLTVHMNRHRISVLPLRR